MTHRSQLPEVREFRQMMDDIMDYEGWKAMEADPPDVVEDYDGPDQPEPEPGPQPIEGVIASYFADLIGGKL